MVRLIGFALLVVLMGLMVSVGYGAEVAAAAERWQPMAGSPVAENLSMGNRKAVRFPCLLGNVKLDRASWDLPVQLDMSRCAGIRFETRCQDPRPIRSFSLYFQSGEGWYAATFAHPPSDQWQTVEVRKEQTHIEGHPAGWNKITAIRISAWRGGEVNTEFAIADLGLVEVEADIALVRGESAAGSSPEEVAPVCQFTEQMADMLRELHLGYVMLSDLDLGPAKLKSYRVVILPHNPKMPASVDQDIADYMNGGGKVIACYGLTRNIAAAGGVVLLQHRPQKWEGQFAAIATDARILPGAPETAKQRSWNIMEVKPAAGTQIAAMWVDQSGKATGMPAILVSPQMIYMSHVFLAEDADTKRRLLLAMIGKLFPEAWSVAAKHAVEEIGRFAAYDSFTTAQQMLAKYPAAEKNLAEAAHQRQTAMTLTGEGKFIEAIDLCTKAQGNMVTAYCAAQEPLAGEQRAFWCHNAAGVAGMSWDQAIKLLADNGFNTIMPNMLWGGVAFYPSKVLPVAPMVSEKGDQIKQCLEACRKYGVKMHVWKVNWNMGWQTPREFVMRMKAAGRTQKTINGTPNDQWLCPSNPANQQLEIEAMVEVASLYEVAGIHFDYIRYPDQDGCYCEGCRERFEKIIGHKVKNWPWDTRNEADTKARWLQFRRDNITSVVAMVAQRVHRERPGVQVSAAVFTNWPVDRDGVGQDWKLWCEKGYLDFVCPMDYTAYNRQFEQEVALQKQWAGKVPVYPGIGLSTWPGASRDVVKLIEQIQITRKNRTGGFTVFEYNTPEAAEIVPLCGMGITRKQ